MINNSLTKNSVANMISRIWSMISIYLFVPIYIKFLGEETYGLVSFFATLQLAMNLLEMGLSSTLKREFAAVESDNNKNRKYKLLRSVETLNLIIASIIFLLCYFGSNFIAYQWLNLEYLDIDIVATTIILMGTSISIQFLSNTYFGCIIGQGYQITANTYQLIWSFCKSVGSILIIWIITPDIRLFYSWHIMCDILYLLALRATVIKKLDYDTNNKWRLKDITILKDIWKYAFGLMLISFIALINRQLDKTIISKYLPLTELGAYNLAFTLGQIPIILSSSVAIALFSKYTKLYSMEKEEEIKSNFLHINKTITIIVVCIGVFVAIYSNELILFWTGSQSIVEIISKTAGFVVIGSMFLGLQEIPYAFVLAHGNTKINNFVGIIFLPIIVSVTFIFVINFKLQGAGIAYCLLMMTQTIIYIIIIHKKYFITDNIIWLLHDTISPIITCFILALLSKYICDNIFTNIYLVLLFAVFSGLLTLLITFFIFDKSNSKLFFSMIKVKLKIRK